ncbi:hypothetical protein [Methanobacterium sp.]|uniref:hypothetical protein n=2 Tax=Methanobacterium sp. TaxID=2164 RepID=UPI003C725F7A
MSILKFIKSEIKVTYRVSVDLILTFEDTKISKEQYSFVKDQLNKYDWYINDEYAMTTETMYKESSGALLIALNIIIPNHIKPKDENILSQMIRDHTNKFLKFYERHMQLHYLETEKKLKNLNYSH